MRDADLPPELAARRKASRRKWYEANKQTILERQREYQRNLSPEKRRVIQVRYAKKNKEKLRKVWDKKNWAKLGFSAPPRERPGNCECCGGTSVKALALDHCHETGVFRGWLCSSCNMGLGLLGDNIESLDRAIDYLKRSSK